MFANAQQVPVSPDTEDAVAQSQRSLLADARRSIEADINDLSARPAENLPPSQIMRAFAEEVRETVIFHRAQAADLRAKGYSELPDVLDAQSDLMEWGAASLEQQAARREAIEPQVRAQLEEAMKVVPVVIQEMSRRTREERARVVNGKKLPSDWIPEARSQIALIETQLSGFGQAVAEAEGYGYTDMAEQMLEAESVLQARVQHLREWVELSTSDKAVPRWASDPHPAFAGRTGVFVPGIQTPDALGRMYARETALALGLIEMKAVSNPPPASELQDLVQAAVQKATPSLLVAIEGGVYDEQAMLDIMTHVYDAVVNRDEHVTLVAHSEGTLLTKLALQVMHEHLPIPDLDNKVRVLAVGSPASETGWPVSRVFYLDDNKDPVVNLRGLDRIPLVQPGEADVHHSYRGYLRHISPKVWNGRKTIVDLGTPP